MQTVGESSSASTGRLPSIWLWVERAAWAFGLTTLALWGAANVAGVAGAQHDLERFEALRSGAVQEAVPLSETALPDLSLWDPNRVHAWRSALSEPAPQPLAV